MLYCRRKESQGKRRAETVLPPFLSFPSTGISPPLYTCRRKKRNIAPRQSCARYKQSVFKKTAVPFRDVCPSRVQSLKSHNVRRAPQPPKRQRLSGKSPPSGDFASKKTRQKEPDAPDGRQRETNEPKRYKKRCRPLDRGPVKTTCRSGLPCPWLQRMRMPAPPGIAVMVLQRKTGHENACGMMFTTLFLTRKGGRPMWRVRPGKSRRISLGYPALLF